MGLGFRFRGLGFRGLGFRAQVELWGAWKGLAITYALVVMYGTLSNILSLLGSLTRGCRIKGKETLVGRVKETLNPKTLDRP